MREVPVEWVPLRPHIVSKGTLEIQSIDPCRVKDYTVLISAKKYGRG